MFQGNYQAAKDQARKAGELDPTYFFPLMLEGWIDLQERKFSDAIPSLKKAKALDSPAFVTAWLAYAYAACGRSNPRHGRNGGSEETVPAMARCCHSTWRSCTSAWGTVTLAIDYLERAHAADSQWMGWLKMDRMFDPTSLGATLRGAVAQDGREPLTAPARAFPSS